MKRVYAIIIALVTSIAVSACTSNERRTAGYGVGGAALGALVGGAISGGKGRGALTGAALGAAAGTITGAAQTRNNIQYCNFRDYNGRIYQAPCN